jgi:hypothetical protein
MAFSGQKLTLTGAPDELIPVVSPTAGDPTAVATFIGGSQVMAGTSSGLSVTQIGPASSVNTPVTFAMSPYTVVSSDLVLMCATSGGAISVVLPTAASSSNRIVQVVDASGSAATNNVTVTVSGAGLINGSASYVINLAYGAASFFSSGAFWVVTNNTASSGGGYATGVRQIVSAAFTGVATGTALMLSNDTVPTNTAGTQFMAVSITPQSATSSLLVTASVGLYYLSAVGTVVSALFRDSTSAAIAASSQGLGASLGLSQVIRVIVPSVSTASTNFRLRMGPAAASTLTFNGFGGGRYFGGVCASVMTIEEFGT